MSMKQLFFSTIGHSLILLGISILTFTYIPILYAEIVYDLSPHQIDETSGSIKTVNKDRGPDYSNIQPYISPQGSYYILISKIGVKAPIVPEVSTANKVEYTKALENGVAHAKGTALPGENGNSFLFAHSSINFWKLGKYATVFNLLNKLENGDTVIIVKDDKPYLYEVFSKEIVKGWNTEPFDVEYSQPVLTLVTCYPPGSTINRLVVKAKKL